MHCAGTSDYICYTFNILFVWPLLLAFVWAACFFCFCFPFYTELNSLTMHPWGSFFLLSSSFSYLPSTKITQPVSTVGSYAHIHHEFVINLLFYPVYKTATLLPTTVKSPLCNSSPVLWKAVLHWRINLFFFLFFPPASDLHISSSQVCLSHMRDRVFELLACLLCDQKWNNRSVYVL